MAENVQIKACVLSISDSRNEKTDLSGDLLIKLLIEIGAEIIEKKIISDDYEEIRQTLNELTQSGDINLIITTGGTGLAVRDNTPEATKAVIEREVPGISEAMRIQTIEKTPASILSRGVCGIKNKTLIINLPGSPKGVEECFDVIKPVLQHAVNQINGKTKH